jgi:hypothetical protein
MRRALGWSAACLVLALASSAAAAATAVSFEGQTPSRTGPVLDQKLVVGDITISYPTGLDSQAQQVAEVCRTVVTPRLEKFRAIARSFSDPRSSARALTRLLGCPEEEESAAALMAEVGEVITFLEPMYTNVRIYREADLKASGGVSGGAVSLAYIPAEDRFQFQVDFHTTRSEGQDLRSPPRESFLPVVVRDDGSFRAQQGLAAHMGGILDNLATPGALNVNFAVIRLAASALLIRRCGPDPFTQWFSDGVAQWVTPRVVQEIAPDYAAQCREMLLPNAPTPEARARVNLLAWPLGEDPRPQDAKDEECAYCAYELMDRLLRDRPAGTLAAIMDKLKDQKPPDTEAILRALDAVLGVDSRSLLLEYVPEPVRTGLREGRPAKLREEGYQALRDGEYSKAVKLLSDALEMTPSDADMRVNLAIAMRRSGIPKQGSERQIRLAAALARDWADREFALQGKADDETWYVLGRIAQQREKIPEAEALFGRLPASHADGQAALKQIEAAENPRAGPVTP